MKKWLLMGVAVVLIAVAVGGYNFYAKKSVKPAATVNTVAVKKGNLVVTVSGTGTVGPVDRETIRAVDSGQVKDVLVKQWDSVKKGQQLVTFMETDNSAAIQQDQLNLQKDQLDLETAQKSLKDQAFGSNVDVDQLKTSIKKLQLSIEQLQLQIQTEQKNQKPVDPITSPIDGVMSSVAVSAGQNLNGGAIVGEVADYNDMQVVIQVDELDIDKVQNGQQAQMTFDAIPNKNFTGTVTQIASEGKSSNGVSVYDVTIHLLDAKNIKAGMNSEAAIKVADKSNVLLVPIEAVQQFNGKSFVFIPSTDTASPTNTNSKNTAGSNATGRKLQSVQVGLQNDSYMEITSGLKEGEQIIIPGSKGTTAQQNGRNFNPGIGGLGGGAFGGGNRGGGSR